MEKKREEKKKERRKYNEQGKKKINRRARETHREPESMVWYTASRRSSNAHAVNETTTHFGLHQRIIQVGRLLERGKISKLKDIFFFLSLSFFLVHVVSQKKKLQVRRKRKIWIHQLFLMCYRQLGLFWHHGLQLSFSIEFSFFCLSFFSKQLKKKETELSLESGSLNTCHLYTHTGPLLSLGSTGAHVCIYKYIHR